VAVTRLLAVVLTVAAVLWIAAIFLVPARMQTRAPVLSAVIYAAAGLVCHQRPERSFHLGGTQLPVCARCTGLYVSGALGALVAWLGASRVPRRMRGVLIASAMPTIITVALEWANLTAPGNVVRASAALPLGAAGGWVFVRLLRVERPQGTCAIIP
jgi:uncharacterized membrane protein